MFDPHIDRRNDLTDAIRWSLTVKRIWTMVSPPYCQCASTSQCQEFCLFRLALRSLPGAQWLERGQPIQIRRSSLQAGFIYWVKIRTTGLGYSTRQANPKLSGKVQAKCGHHTTQARALYVCVCGGGGGGGGATELYYRQKTVPAQDPGTETWPVKGLHCAFWWNLLLIPKHAGCFMS